jgi:hydroxymethylglutaryl-CoA synthase
VPLSEHGVIEAVTTISRDGAPPEFAELQSRAGEYVTVIVRFEAEGGGEVSLPAFVTDTDSGAVMVGDEVWATIRRIYTQEGVTRYGLKVVPG